jgi:hypothetical protein
MTNDDVIEGIALAQATVQAIAEEPEDFLAMMGVEQDYSEESVRVFKSYLAGVLDIMRGTDR